MNNTILVTGGAGFIGSAFVRRLVPIGVGVVNVDALTYAGNLATVAGVAGHPGYEFVHADIRARDAMTALLERHMPRAVVHFAAESHVDRSIDGPERFIDTNVMGTCRLLDAALAYWLTLPPCDAARFRFVHVSTDEVFGTLGETGYFTEDTPRFPNSPYAASKAASDALARAWHRTYGLPTLITNCSNNYGPYQHPEKLIPLMIGKALDFAPMPVYGRGANVRDWLFVEDHVDALLAVLERGTVGESYNVGGGTEITNLELVRQLCAIMDERVPATRPRTELITFVADRPGHDFRYAIDSTRVRRDTGWRPRESFDSGLRRTVEWYLSHPDWLRSHGTYGGERLGLGRRASRSAADVRGARSPRNPIS